MKSKYEILSWLEDRIESLLNYPEMWGSSSEVIELEMLTILEFRVFIIDEINEDRTVINLWTKFLADNFELYNTPLHMLYVNVSIKEFADLLRPFVIQIYEKFPKE